MGRFTPVAEPARPERRHPLELPRAAPRVRAAGAAAYPSAAPTDGANSAISHHVDGAASTNLVLFGRPWQLFHLRQQAGSKRSARTYRRRARRGCRQRVAKPR